MIRITPNASTISKPPVYGLAYCSISAGHGWTSNVYSTSCDTWHLRVRRASAFLSALGTCFLTSLPALTPKRQLHLGWLPNAKTGPGNMSKPVCGGTSGVKTAARLDPTPHPRPPSAPHLKGHPHERMTACV